MNDQSIRDRLLDMEKRNPELEEQFKKELNKMFEKKLTTSGKIEWILASLGGVAFAVGGSYVAIAFPQELPWLGRVFCMVGAVGGTAWAALGVWILKKGSFNWLEDENSIHVLTFCLMVLFMIILLLLGNQIEDRTKAIHIMLSGVIFFLIFGLPASFNMRINRTEASLREQLLKIELKMAELAEKTGHKT